MEALLQTKNSPTSQDTGSIYFDLYFDKSPWLIWCSSEGSTVMGGFREKINPSLSSRKMISKLQEFKNLKSNWDSYNADVPSNIAIMNAINFILKADNQNLNVYFVAPGRSGEILVEFKGENEKAAEIYFNPNGSSELLLFANEECFYEGDLDFRKLLSYIL